ncbi:Hypothetical protein SRAE_2000241600 [Strongyloides ratti]|uniref:Uncharacterized protein n=1 Tax=Strongyloides ratti TaxID=34506 RepID=A0A090LJR5_STRRB|nr:Hypothetical protein SRAE_2000241600 [Strongyloides ratti]CEF67755.1 Hypothetical protein SRAE_2000241600 [Strongyloides ratti]
MNFYSCNQKNNKTQNKKSFCETEKTSIIPINCWGTTLAEIGIKDSWLPPGSRIRNEKYPEIELLSKKELLESIDNMRRSYSVDSLGITREKYLSRWSRENTPHDCMGTYDRAVRRSYSNLRDIANVSIINDQISSGSRTRRTPIALVTTPYYTNVNYYSESQPLRKYDVFQLRTWSYPIYKYIYGRDQSPSRPYSYTRDFACTPKYTPPIIGAEARGMNERRGYSGYSYMAGEHSFNISAKPWSLGSARVIASPYISKSPSSYYDPYNGFSTLRHYNRFRPRSYSARYNTYWKPYY